MNDDSPSNTHGIAFAEIPSCDADEKVYKLGKILNIAKNANNVKWFFTMFRRRGEPTCPWCAA